MQMDGFLTLKGGNVELVGAPETIFVLPIGHVVSSKGEFDVDGESYKAMKAQIAKRGVDLVVDYEHQTLKGCEAPAAGWVKELKLEDGQIKAVVEWTPRGARECPQGGQQGGRAPLAGTYQHSGDRGDEPHRQFRQF